MKLGHTAPSPSPDAATYLAKTGFPCGDLSDLAIQGLGDTGWFKEGIWCGVHGSLKLVEGFAIRLTGPNASQFNIFYQANVHGTGDTDVFQDGDFCGSRGTGIQVEAMRLWVTKR